jgi:hypothetical protein
MSGVSSRSNFSNGPISCWASDCRFNRDCINARHLLERGFALVTSNEGAPACGLSRNCAMARWAVANLERQRRLDLDEKPHLK